MSYFHANELHIFEIETYLEQLLLLSRTAVLRTRSQSDQSPMILLSRSYFKTFGVWEV